MIVFWIAKVLFLFVLVRPHLAFRGIVTPPLLNIKFQQSRPDSNIICRFTNIVRGSGETDSHVKSQRSPTSDLSSSSSIKRSSTIRRTNDKLERDLLALRTFLALYGHLRVPYYYIIPNGPDAPDNFRLRRKRETTSSISTATTSANNVNLCNIYPAETHGLRLGLRLARIRKGEVNISDEQRAKLLELGLTITDPTSSSSFSSVKEADSANERSDDASRLKQWSCKAYSTDRNFNVILSALQVHDQLYGDMLVPRYFVVPSEDPWPLDTWGLQLGNRVRNIRQRRAYNKPRYHQILIDAGFVMDLKILADELKIKRFSSH